MFIRLSVLTLAIFTQLFAQDEVKEEFVVSVPQENCDLQSNNLDKVGDVWYDTDNCKKFECIGHNGVATVKQYSCAETLESSPGCRMVKGKGLFPNCCYGSIVCDRKRSIRHSSSTMRRNWISTLKKRGIIL